MREQREKLSMKNKSTIAKLLSEEDIHVVYKQMETAYFNPKTGPSMRLGLKYDNVGPSMTTPVKNISKTTSGDIKTNPTILESLDKKNIKTIKKEGASFKSLDPKNTPANKNKRSKIQQVGDYARGFDANVNIGGFRFNVGQMVDLGLRAGSAIDKKVKSRKILKEQDKAYENKKQSAAKAKEQEDYKNAPARVGIDENMPNLGGKQNMINKQVQFFRNLAFEEIKFDDKFKSTINPNISIVDAYTQKDLIEGISGATNQYPTGLEQGVYDFIQQTK